jgi:hypothetical protein
MYTKPINAINYKGVPLADYKVKGIDACYKLYKVDNNDKEFLSKMYRTVNLKKLMPNLHEYDYINWDGIIKEAIYKTNDKDRITIIETCNDKPCGILNFTPQGKEYCLNFIATFPIKIKKRVPCGGQILFNKLFKNFINSDAESINLSALKTAPFSPISKYRELGFISTGGDDWLEDMTIYRDGIEIAIEKQDKFLSSKQVEKETDLDLGQIINLKI